MTTRSCSINCSDILETLLESELFGFEKGAFTDASAGNAGILEVSSGRHHRPGRVGEMPLLAQAKMLRVLRRRPAWYHAGHVAVQGKEIQSPLTVPQNT